MRHAALAPVLLLIWIAAGSAPPAALADDRQERMALVVLDRGEDARATADDAAATALELVRGLEAQDREVLLVAAGTSKNGRLKLAAPTATRKGIADLADKKGFTFKGPTDPRDVLRAVLVTRAAGDPVDLLLVGPFSASSSDAPARRTQDLEKAVSQWNERAPAGSRVYPFALSTGAQPALEGVRGLAARGWFVTGFSRAVANAKPFSPLAEPQGDARTVLLEAEIRVAAHVLRAGSAGHPPRLLTAATDLPDDHVTNRAVESLHVCRIQRPLRDGRTVTASFRPTEEEDVHWLCDAPEPLTFRWDRLAPDARLLAADGSPKPIFEAIDAVAGTPVLHSFRVVRTRSGPTPAWREVLGPTELLPKGLRWSIGEEAPTSADLVESVLRVEFHARPASPLDTKGVLTLRADGMPAALEVPFVLRVRPGRATVELDPRPAALPPAQIDSPTRLRIHAEDANVPASLAIEAGCETDHLPWLFARVDSPDGRSINWALTEPLSVAVGVDHTLVFDLHPDAPADLPWPCSVTVRCAATAGVLTEGEGRVVLRLRRPRLVVAGEPVLLRIEDGRPAAVHPLVLRLDADGGDGEWVLELIRSPPAVETIEGDVRAWDVQPQEPGVWHVHPHGAWGGAAASVFDEGRAAVRVSVVWERGSTPGVLSVPVEIPARWGSRGWLFVGLAFLAVLLGVATFVLMRAPRVTGTLLYASPDLPGTVGRLDLTPVGRRATPIFVDARGRLSLTSGTQMVMRVRPTRVGGMLEVLVGPSSGDRRLLVDGLSLGLEKHTARYVSGRPAEQDALAAMADVPDLLGSEFDIESGRIDSL